MMRRGRRGPTWLDALFKLPFCPFAVGHGDSAGVSCFAFNAATQRHGFPFETASMPDRPHKDADKSELTLGEKLLLAREVAELVQKYQSYEMANAIRGVKDYVAGEGAGASDRWALCLKVRAVDKTSV